MSKVERVLSEGLTVRELIDELRSYSPQAKVVFGCDYGDRCHTEQALPVCQVDEISDEEYLKESGYSTSGVSIERSEDANIHRAATDGSVIVLRYQAPN